MLAAFTPRYPRARNSSETCVELDLPEQERRDGGCEELREQQRRLRQVDEEQGECHDPQRVAQLERELVRVAAEQDGERQLRRRDREVERGRHHADEGKRVAERLEVHDIDRGGAGDSGGAQHDERVCTLQGSPNLT